MNEGVQERAGPGRAEALPERDKRDARDAPDARERLLDAAERLYAQKGSRGMTTRAVSAAAGVSELTLFRQFGSKRGLLQAMTRRLAEVPFVEKTLTEANTGDLEADLCHVARTIIPNARAMLPFVLQAIAEAAEHPEHLEVASARPQAALKRLAAFFAQRMDAGQVRRGHPLLMAHAFSAMMVSRLVVAPLYKGLIDQPEGEIVEAFVHIFVQGIAAPEAPEGPWDGNGNEERGAA